MENEPHADADIKFYNGERLSLRGQTAFLTAADGHALSLARDSVEPGVFSGEKKNCVRVCVSMYVCMYVCVCVCVCVCV